MCLKHVQTQKHVLFQYLMIRLGIFCFILLALLSGSAFQPWLDLWQFGMCSKSSNFHNIFVSVQVKQWKEGITVSQNVSQNHTRAFWFFTHFFLLSNRFPTFFTDFQTDFPVESLLLHCQVLLLLLAVAQESGQAVRGIAKILMINFHKTFDYIVYHLLYIMEQIFSDYV